MIKTFTISGVEVLYTSRAFGGNTAPYDHFEFRSEFMGDTGYRSHFEPTASVSAQGGPEVTAKDLIGFYWTVPDTQLGLFD